MNEDVIDWSKLANELSTESQEAIKPYLEAEQADLRNFGVLVGREMSRAIRLGEPLREVEAQFALLAEITRIRGNAVSWDLAERALKLVFRVAVAALTAT